MRPRFACLAVCLVAAAIGTAPLHGQRAESRVTLDALLDRAAWYIDYFIDQFENVVAEESYVQDSTSLLPTITPLAGRGGTLPTVSAADATRARHRDLRADFLLVKAPDTSALVAF